MENTSIQSIEFNFMMGVIPDGVDSSSDEEDVLPFFKFGDIEEEQELGTHLLQHVCDLVETENIPKIDNYIEKIVPQYSDEQFTMHFRIQKGMFRDLVSRFQNSNIFQTLLGHGGMEAISPEKHILVFLWFAGHQTASYRDVADRFDLSLAGLYDVISRVTDFLISISSLVIRLPNVERKRETKEHYLRAKKFPGVIASIDATDIRIDRPKNDPDAYINRKRFFSLKLQGLVDERRKFIDVVVGWPGSVHDARVFANSPTKEYIENLCHPGEYVLGDSAYPCLPFLITPYRDNGHLTRAQKNFNKILSSCRVSVEHCFGILKQRFRQLYFLRLRNKRRMVRFIYACCVLRNLADEEDLKNFEAPEQDDLPDPDAPVNILDNLENVDLTDDLAGKDIRDELCRQLAPHQ